MPAQQKTEVSMISTTSTRAPVNFTRTQFVLGLLLLSISFFAVGTAQAQDKPNILIIWGDDVGWMNTSAYNRGMMGYKTPNIDSIAADGAMFTDWYGQQSCTAGRAAFVTGQSPFRTGLLKVGLPGAKEGLSEKDPTIAGLLKNHGYMTAQYGKNHLGDLDEHLPTNHGFDEFFGNLYHLNAEEEPENADYPKNPEFAEPRVCQEIWSSRRYQVERRWQYRRYRTADQEAHGNG
jgi:arylsulfatase